MQYEFGAFFSHTKYIYVGLILFTMTVPELKAEVKFQYKLIVNEVVTLFTLCSEDSLGYFLLREFKPHIGSRLPYIPLKMVL